MAQIGFDQTFVVKQQIEQQKGKIPYASYLQSISELKLHLLLTIRGTSKGNKIREIAALETPTGNTNSRGCSLLLVGIIKIIHIIIGFELQKLYEKASRGCTRKKLIQSIPT